MALSSSTSPKTLSGPSAAFDLNTTEESFKKIAELIEIYGDYIQIEPISRSHNAVLINNPDAVKYMLVNNHQNYLKGPGFERVKMLLGNGIIVSDGQYWRKQRRMIQPSFSRQCIQNLTGKMLSANRHWLQRWQNKAAAGQTIDVTVEVSELSLEIILRSLIGDDLDTLISQEGGNPFSILTDNLVRDMQLAIQFRGLRKLVQQLIDQRRTSSVRRHDFLEAFIEARDKDSGEGMTDGEIINEVMTLIIAGHETGATTLNWAWYLLSQNPRAEDLLHAEVDCVVSGDLPTFDEVGQLQYSRQIIEETLRLYPPVWLYSRTAVDDDNVCGYDVPAGTNIFFTPYYLHRHPGFWDNPEQFQPERFEPANVKKRHPFAFIPFSAGPRRCIGDYFSMVELQIHLGTMAKAFRLTMTGDRQIELDPQINLRSKNNIIMQLSTR